MEELSRPLSPCLLNTEGVFLKSNETSFGSTQALYFRFCILSASPGESGPSSRVPRALHPSVCGFFLGTPPYFLLSGCCSRRWTRISFSPTHPEPGTRVEFRRSHGLQSCASFSSAMCVGFVTSLPFLGLLVFHRCLLVSPTPMLFLSLQLSCEPLLPVGAAFPLLSPRTQACLLVRAACTCTVPPQPRLPVAVPSGCPIIRICPIALTSSPSLSLSSFSGLFI